MNRRRFLTLVGAATLSSRPGLHAVDGPAELLFVSALGPDHPLTQSFVSQLLEQGIWFHVDPGQMLPESLPAGFETHRAVVLDTPATEAVLANAGQRAALDAFARQGGFVFRLESPPSLDAAFRSLFDLHTMHRVADLVAHADLTRLHPQWRTAQLARPVAGIRAEMREALVGKLSATRWSEYLLHNWKAALALIESGDESLREPLATAIRRASRNVPTAAHHDHVAGGFGAVWLAETTGEREALERVRAQVDEMLERRPRTLGLASGYGFTDDPLRLAGVEPGAPPGDALMHTVMRRDTVWTEMLHMHSATFAALARATGEERYRDELLRLIAHVRDHHLRPDGLLAHSTRHGQPIASAWTRGQTHALYGLIYTLQELAGDDPARADIVDLLDRVGRGLLAHQDEATGLWRNVIDHPDARLESSGTTGIVFAYAHAVRRGWLPRERYETMLRHAWDGLRGLHWRGGLAANCRGTGVGTEVSYYLARPQGWAWMPQLIPAMVELERLGLAESS